MSLITSVRDSLTDAYTTITDSLVNLLTGLGTSKDPRSSSQFYYQEITRVDLEAMYRSDWLARRIVDLPAQDATREWRTWTANEKDKARIEKLERHLQIRQKVRMAIERARLYGGAALVLGVEQGMPWEELDIDKVGLDGLRFIIVCNRYELMAGPRIYDVSSPYYTRPEYYTVGTPTIGMLGEKAAKATGFDLYSSRSPGTDAGIVRVHPSRVIEFVGNELPDWRLAPMGGGWGDSVLQTVKDALTDFAMIQGGLAAMINDMKMDVVRVPDLTQKLSTADKTQKTMQRFMAANAAKSTVNTLLLDKEEEWSRISTSFGSTPDLIRVSMTIACGAGGIPESRVMGSAPNKGLSGAGGSGGEVDIRNYYDDIASKQRSEYRPRLYVLDRIIVLSATGKNDPGIDYAWTPLYQPTAQEKAQLALTKAQTTQQYVTMGLFNEDVLREAASSQISEDEVYPGWDDAIEEFGLEPEEPELDPGLPPPPPGMVNKGHFEPNPYAMLQAQKATASGKPLPKLPVHKPPPTGSQKLVKDFNPNHDESGKFASGGGGGAGGGSEFDKSFGELAAKYPDEMKAHLAALASGIRSSSMWNNIGAGEGSEGAEAHGGEELPEHEKAAREAKETWSAIAHGITGLAHLGGNKRADVDRDMKTAIASAVGAAAGDTAEHLVHAGWQLGLEHLTEVASEAIGEGLHEVLGYLTLGNVAGGAGAAIGTALAGPVGGVVGAGLGKAVARKATELVVERVADKLGVTPNVAKHLVIAGAKGASAYAHEKLLAQLNSAEPTLRAMASYERQSAVVPVAGGGLTDSPAGDAQTLLDLIELAKRAVGNLDAFIMALQASSDQG